MSIWQRIRKAVSSFAAAPPTRPAHGRRLPSRRPMLLETLEDRRLLAIFSVNSLVDAVDTNVGDGLALDAAGKTTLRAAIMEANYASGGDTINLPAGTYNLTLAGFGEGAAATGDLDIKYSVSVIGAGAASTIINASTVQDRIFDLSNSAAVEIRGLTLTGGRADNSGVYSLESYGGAIRADFYNNLTIADCVFNANSAPNSATGSVYGIGGAIYSSARTLNIQNTVFTGNYASNNGGAIAASGTVGGVPGVVAILNSTFSSNSARDGGAIDSSHNLTVTGSTFSGNYGASPSVGGGGAINSSSSSLVVTNSTFSGNSGPFGGAISTSYGSLAILNSTITGNSASRGGGLEVSSSAVSAENAIIAGNTATSGPDVYGAVTSLGHNLVGNTAGSSGFGVTGDLLGANPLLGPLANNGGPTWTHALLTGSPAIDAANTAAAPATDQRGIARYNSVADIGAFEWSPGGRISGTVFSDPNANGLPDTGEPGVPDWTIYLDENGNGQYDGDATTATYVSSDAPKDIDTDESNHVVTSVLTVPTIVRFVSDVNVTVDIKHAYDADLNVFLIGPDGTRVELFTAVGGGGDDFNGTILDDEAATSIRTGAAPFTGLFRPEGKLLQFDGKRATGDWTLEITDTYPGTDGGALLNWSIEFTLGEPATLTDATGAYTFTDLPTGTYTVAGTQRRGWLQTAPASDTYTLYLTPGWIISGRDFGNFELPSQTTTIPVSADGEGWDPELDGVYVLDTTSTAFRVGNTPSNYSGDMRGLAEFNLGSLPAHESVSDATLELNWSSITGQSDVDYYCEVYGYAGNGAVTVDDVKQTATLVGRFFADFDHPAVYSIPIDPVFLQSMRAISQYVGFVLLMPEVNNAWIAFHSKENTWGDPYDPKLTVKTSVESLNGEIRGHKWSDADSDGVWDTGEPALAGWEIYLDLNEDGQYNDGIEPIALTDASGAYAFTDIAPGDYVVAERMKAGWEQTYPGITPPPPVSQFQIDIDFDTGSTFSDTQKQIIQDAAARWSEIIIGDVPDMTTTQFGLVDDLLIEASTRAIDGVGGILGQAGPTQLRPGSYLPVLGTMEFDTADVGNLEASGQLDEVILHEMAHVLGFGTIWTQLGLLSGEGTTDPRFIGAAATAEYQAIFSNSETSVPVENTGGAGTQDAHWRETTFDTELMTGWLDPGVPNPISRITAAQFGDLGYEVYLAGADAYTKPASLQAGLRLDTGDWGKILTLEAEPVVLPESAIVAPQANFGGIEPLGGTNPNIPYTHWVSVSIGEIVEDIDFGNHLARTLTVQIAAAAVLENAGPAATTVTITRTGNTTSELVVNLTSSDPTEATVPARATIPAGQASVTVSLDAVDDTLLDGTQTVTITATEIFAGGTGLDTGFGASGYAATPLHVLTSDSRPGLVILPDGSIIGVGDDATGSDNAWQVVKVTPAGQLDATFGSGGVVATSFGTGGGLPHAVALQADGKIVVAGEAKGGTTIYEDIALARYNANGSLDTSFAQGGKLRMEFDTGHASAYDLLVLPDGKLLIIGVGPLGVFLMSRFNSDGSFDTTFGTGGTLTIPYTIAGSALYYTDAELMPDGRFVVVTQLSSTTIKNTWIVSRFNPDGSFDASFDVDGRQQISFPRGYAYPYALALQDDGRIVAAGKVYDDYSVAPREDMAATRLNDDGSIDTSFGVNGRFIYDFSDYRDIANDVVVRPDGRIVLVGTLADPLTSNKGYALGLVGLAPDGKLDPLFAQSGVYFGEPLASVFEEIEAGVLDEQGRLVTIAGYGDDIRVARFVLGQDGLTAEATLDVTDDEGLAQIHGSKWHDLDADGVWDAGEPGLAGATIYLDLNGDGQLSAGEPKTVTAVDNPATPGVNEAGTYEFLGLVPGDYTVAEDVTGGFRQRIRLITRTQPAS
ncbi:MAG: SdrD B-like domain-containing protein [Thermoguttaceae bacterium]